MAVPVPLFDASGAYNKSINIANVLSADQEGALRAGHGLRVVIQDVKETLFVTTQYYPSRDCDITIKTQRVFHGTGTASSHGDAGMHYYGVQSTSTIPDRLHSEVVGALHYVAPPTLGQATKFTCTNDPQGVLVVFSNDANRVVGCFKGAQIGSDTWKTNGSFRFV